MDKITSAAMEMSNINEPNDKINNYCQLWDGSERWGLELHRYSKCDFKVNFAGSQPTSQEIIALRKLVEKYRYMSITKVKLLLQNQKELSLGHFHSREGKKLQSQAEALGLVISVEFISYTRCLPINLQTNDILTLPDTELSDRIVAKMQEVGIQVINPVVVD
jgi:hypothetical protein